MQGRCIDPGATLTLELNKVYYLFPNGPHAYYVSRFNRQGAHFGCYQAAHFELIQEQQEDWPPEPAAAPINLDPGKLYLARLIWRRPGYKQTKLQHYYIKPGKTHAYFYRQYYAGILEEFGGCFPQHWFTDFQEIQEELPEIQEQEPQQQEEQIELFERDNGQLAFF
jgi:hypothetical protein